MKKVYLTILPLFLSTFGFSQGRYHALDLTAGISYFNTKTLALSYETEKDTKLNVGAIVEGIYYRKYQGGKINLRTDNRYLAIGAFLTASLHKTRNFSSNAFLGAAIGTDNKDLLWYPLVGLKQTYYFSNTFQIITSENLSYYMEKHFIAKSLQPALLIGLQYQH